jgi:hypothetical protein
MRVVAVGCFPTPPPSSVGIFFWEGTNRIIATYQVLISPHEGLLNGIAYQPVDGLILKAGSFYAISIDPGQGDIPVHLYSTQGADGMETFGPAPFISDFGNYEVSTNGEWTPLPPPPSSNADLLLLGPTFQFQLLRELTLAQAGPNLLLSWPTQNVSYVVQMTHSLGDTNWVSLTNGYETVGGQDQLTVPKPTGTTFFRLASQ